MKRVPTHTPSAPSDRAAASPRPSKIPPAATTGTCPATASTIWGTRAMVATWPVWPPASVPWATTMSQPAATARRAWSTLPHMLITSTPCLWHSSMTSRGTPRPATNTLAPPSDLAHLGGEVRRRRRQQVDPEGLVGERLHRPHLVDHLHRLAAAVSEAGGFGCLG